MCAELFRRLCESGGTEQKTIIFCARDRHADLKAGFIIANPPFNDSDWGGERLKDDKRWKLPVAGNANLAWMQQS